jgi:hypothetical protein
MAAIINVGRWIKKQISELNFFEIETVRSENFDIQKAIISTRVYIILLTLTSCIPTILAFLENARRKIKNHSLLRSACLQTEDSGIQEFNSDYSYSLCCIRQSQ